MDSEPPKRQLLRAEYLESTLAPLRGAVGFLLLHGAPAEVRTRVVDALDSLLQYFPWLHWGSFRLGSLEVILWSHRSVTESVTLLPNQEGLFLVGSSPIVVAPALFWPGVVKDNFQLPWNGRTVLLKVAPSGDDWNIWTDWCGSIPVYHSTDDGPTVVSSLEPLVVKAKAWGKDDLSPRGVAEILRFGHFVGTHTTFRNLRNLAPDSRSIWCRGRHQGTRSCQTVRPSDKRLSASFDDLVEELAATTRAAIWEGLASSDEWILPLSGGLDSRVIAGEMARTHKRVHAFTYDTSYRNLVCGREVAAALRFPWARVRIPPSFLERFTPLWLDWFGCSVHAHGMYQMPFLEDVRDLDAPIAVGFLGGLTAGEHVHHHRAGEPLLDQLSRLSMGWPVPELKQLLVFDPAPIFEQVSEEIHDIFATVDGAEFQRFALFDLWTRQRHLVFYHPVMCDYWKGVSTPYFNSDFARFYFSVSREMLDQRRLFIALLKRHYPRLACVPGTFTADGKPPVQTQLFRLRHAIGRRLPNPLKKGPFAVFGNVTFSRAADAVRNSGLQALFPMGWEGAVSSCPLFKPKAVQQLLDQALQGDLTAIGRMARLQPVIHQCLNT